MNLKQNLMVFRARGWRLVDWNLEGYARSVHFEKLHV